MIQGHSLNVFDISPTACTALQTNGVTIAKSPEEVALKSDFVISMLPNSQIVYDTYEQITRSGVNNKTIFIDSSTIDPNVVKKVNNLITWNELLENKIKCDDYGYCYFYK